MSNLKITQRFPGGGMRVSATDGITFSFTLSPSLNNQLRVSWASDWEMLFTLKQDGLLLRTFDKHIWGHIEFFATPKLLAVLRDSDPAP